MLHSNTTKGAKETTQGAQGQRSNKGSHPREEQPTSSKLDSNQQPHKTMPTSNNSPHLTTTTGYCDDCKRVGETRPLALCRDAYTFMQGEIARQMEIKTGRRDDRSDLQRVFEDEENFFDMVQ